MQTWSWWDQAPTWHNGIGGDGSVQRHLRQSVHVPADQAQDDVESDVVKPIGQVLAGEGIFFWMVRIFVSKVYSLNNCC